MVAIAAAFAFGLLFARITGERSHPTGRTFYVNPDGNDASDGSSLGRAWRTLDRVSKERLRPGDRVLLAGRLTGTLSIGAGEAGDAGNPVVIDSIGQARAAIVAQVGIDVRDTAGITIRNVDIYGSGTGDEDAGVRISASKSVGSRLEGITLENLDVSGFQNGIAVSAEGPAGFADVAIANLASHGNRNNGVVIFGPTFDNARPAYAHTRVAITGVMAYDNAGSPTNDAHNTGNGIVVGSVDTGRIALSTAYANGSRAGNKTEGPLGIWAYDSTHFTIEQNLSYNNQTLGADGGGFGLDQNTSDSVIQRNLSYGNAGEGILLIAQRSNQSNSRNTVRHNISINDSRNGFQGAISLVGGAGGGGTGQINDARVYQNTVIVEQDAPRAPALLIVGTLENTAVVNNILAGPLSVANEQPAGGVRLLGNNYSAKGPVAEWGDEKLADLAQLRQVTGTEQLDGKATGLEGNPGLLNPAVPTNIGRATQLAGADGFIPRPDSPVISGGVPLSGAGIDDPGDDFFGTSIRPAQDFIGAIAR